jgi:hypothetical protein
VLMTWDMRGSPDDTGMPDSRLGCTGGTREKTGCVPPRELFRHRCGELENKPRVFVCARRHELQRGGHAQRRRSEPVLYVCRSGIAGSAICRHAPCTSGHRSGRAFATPAAQPSRRSLNRPGSGPAARRVAGIDLAAHRLDVRSRQKVDAGQRAAIRSVPLPNRNDPM